MTKADSRIPLSILDLVPVSQGMTRKTAFDETVKLAELADRLDYKRYWVAEHHGSDTFVSSATSLVLGRLAEHTTNLRLGSGGVMLPNHAPLMVAEYYGTLATMYGDRFDLGLGRAPGTDPRTAAALHRGHSALNTFGQDVANLISYFADPEESGERGVDGVRAIPGEATKVPLWMLGSSTGGAQVAARLGLPFAFASHFAPDEMRAALHLYRSDFDASAPTAQVDKPTVMAGINVLVAPTQQEAEFLFTSAQLMRMRIRTGQSAPVDRPVQDLSAVVPEALLPYGGRPTGRATAVGDPQRVTDLLEQFVAEHELDELIVTTYTHDPQMRRRSYELLAEAWHTA